MKTPKKRWGVERRLEFIEFRLFWEGRFNRADLVNQFRVSIPQSSADISQYMELCPDNMKYDRKEKAYFTTIDYGPVLIKPNADLYLSQLHSLSKGMIKKEDIFINQLPAYDILPGFQQRVDPKILRSVVKAITGKKAIEVEYQSLSRSKPIWRWISPHSIASDQFRWHTRAFCHNHFEFRDFVLTRILNIKGENQSYSNPDDDEAWHQIVTVKIGPHPKLKKTQKKAIELDYGMTKGVAEVRVRAALLFYFLQQHGFLSQEAFFEEDKSAHQEKHQAIQQIILLNRDEVQKHLPENVKLA
jgi:hypothetical protein